MVSKWRRSHLLELHRSTMAGSPRLHPRPVTWQGTSRTPDGPTVPPSTDAPARSVRASRNTLGLRLALAFLAVALAAVALLAGLAAAFVSADVSSLASGQRAELASAVAVAAGAAWDRNDSWASADLSPLLDLAARSGVDLQVRDAAGRTVASSPGFATGTAPTSSAPVVVQGQHLGTVLVRFSGSGLGAADNVLRTALLRAIAGAAGLAALLALTVGLALARRITRPIARLINATRSMAGGDRTSRADTALPDRGTIARSVNEKKFTERPVGFPASAVSPTRLIPSTRSSCRRRGAFTSSCFAGSSPRPVAKEGDTTTPCYRRGGCPVVSVAGATAAAAVPAPMGCPAWVNWHRRRMPGTGWAGPPAHGNVHPVSITAALRVHPPRRQ
jgi:HAMP domain